LFSVAVLVFFQILAYFYYTLFLGFNRAARWGMGQVVRGWASLVLLFVGYHLAGLRGAFLGYLVAEIMVLAIGIIWARPFNIRPIMIPDWSGLAPYLRFGLIFFASDLLMATFQRGGQTLVRGVTGDYTQVGFFGAAYNIYITLATILPQLTLAFLPLLSSFLIRGRLGDIREWAERLHKWLAIGGMLVLFAVLMLGDNLVPLMLGSAFRPMVIHLLILTMALPLFALITVGRLLTMVWDRPGIALETAAVQLAVFFSLGIWFIARQGSLGGCLAVLGSTAVSGLYMTCRLRSVMRYSLRMWAWVIAFGGFFFPLVWLRSTWMMNTVLYGSFIAGYTGMLIFTRVLTRDEVNTLWRFVRAGRIRLEPTP
jgi:O-antigen/teichoic acid export membrane protein